MPGCCVRNCRNRAEQGFRLFRFSADEKRKKIWIEQCAEHPKGDLRLCEFHFDDSQFENKRQDGRRKLKPNAIPTIFINEESINEIVQDETESSVDVLPEENVIDQINIPHVCNNQSAHVDTETQTEVYNNVVFNTVQFSDKDGTIKQANEIKYLKKKLAETIKKNDELGLKFKKEKLLRLKQKKAYQNSKKKNATFKKKIEKIPFLKEFGSGLTNRRPNWSPQCLKLAMQIRYAVGWKAYLYLKKDLKLPLPSYSTLCRHISKLDFSPGVLKEVILLMKKKRETHTSSHQADCVLLMDEMDICKTLEYDVSTGNTLGACPDAHRSDYTPPIRLLRREELG